jgi:hypothetical protein
LMSTPWLNWEDKIWGYRFVCRSLLGDNSISVPQDRGISFEGRLGETFDYALTFTDGQGIFQPDIDGIVTTEFRGTYSFNPNVKFSLGGGSGTKATDYAYPEYYSATYKYGVANIYYKAKPYTVSYTLLQTYRLDSDYVVNGISYSTESEKNGKGSSFSLVWNVTDNWDLLGRQDFLDLSIETPYDAMRKSICGIGWHYGDNMRLAVTKQAVLSDSTSTALHTTVLNSELKF